MKLPIPHFLSKKTEEDIDNTVISPSLWLWPHYCHCPRTLSFRTAIRGAGHVSRTASREYSTNQRYDDLETEAETKVPETEDDSSIVEMAVRSLKLSERLFFEPGETRSILEEWKRDCSFPLIKESLVISMESQDPYADFRKSMEEMVRASGLKDWDGLKGLLDWYLRVNGKANHSHILGAFGDLLVNIQAKEAISHPAISAANFPHHHNYNSSLISPSSPLSLCNYSASTSSSSNSLSTPSVSMFEAEETSGGSVPCSSFVDAYD